MFLTSSETGLVLLIVKLKNGLVPVITPSSPGAGTRPGGWEPLPYRTGLVDIENVNEQLTNRGSMFNV